MKCLGILREAQNSPGRQGDDEAVLRAALDALRGHGVQTELARPEIVNEINLTEWDIVLPMCETYPRLKCLESLAQNSRAVFMNHPRAVLGTYRENLVATLARTPGVRLPQSELRSVRGGGFIVPEFAAGGFWMKRGDVHNTCDHDVVFAADAQAAEVILQDFSRREITGVILQEHVEGDLIKFYGVGPGQWFTWFHHDPAVARRLAFSPGDLAAMAEAAACAVGLDIFGGDAIVSPDGQVYLLDLNSWPSFARVRSEAAVQISRLVLSRLAAKKSRRNA